MAKNSWNDYSTTAASNTDVHSVSIAEGMAPSDVNNAMRELMVDVANFDQGNVTLTSALAVASGGTGATSAAAARTALGITDAESAYAGVLEANANFVDQAIFGPSVDGQAWNGKWGVASLYSSLMLVTIEDAGADTEVNIWDLTEVSSSAPSTTPLGTVTITGAATPTSVAACMGYIIVGSEDGVSIIDPHSGAWAERTVGWPRSLTASTTPALADNDVVYVAAGFSDAPPLDPRTCLPMPCFGVSYGTGSVGGSLLKDDGNVWDNNGTVGNAGCAFSLGAFFLSVANSQRLITTGPISAVTADGWAKENMTRNDSFPYTFDPENGMDMHGYMSVAAHGSGLGIAIFNDFAGVRVPSKNHMTVKVTSNVNTGYMVGDIRGAWLANSATADRSYKANTLTANGSITAAAVASGAELQGYSGFSASNNLTRASDADWDVITTGALYATTWFKTNGNAAIESFIGFENAGSTLRFLIRMEADGTLLCFDDGATASPSIQTTAAYDDNAWHKVDWVRYSSTSRELFVDGVSIGVSTTDAGSLSSTGNLPLGIGVHPQGSSTPATASTLALVRLSATAPTATQIRQMYDAEKGMFVASAECLLQSGSTDAVLDVDVDPLTGKVLVTQTDAITIFDGLVVDSKPTVNSGASEKGKLWGDLRAEQNSANAYVTAPAVDQRQVNEMVRGLANDLPAGVDLGKAKAWLCWEIGYSGNPLVSSYNIKSTTVNSSGVYTMTFGIPFKATTSNSGIAYAVVATIDVGTTLGYTWSVDGSGSDRTQCKIRTANASNAAGAGNTLFVAFFGEIENE
jgi:hypothetical protein